MAKNKLTKAQKKSLKDDISIGKLTRKKLCEKYKISSSLVDYYRKNQKKGAKEKVLEMKKVIDVMRADSMLYFLMDGMIEDIKEMDTDKKKYSADKRLKEKRETIKEILQVRNSVAFTMLPEGSEDYTNEDVDFMEALQEVLTDEQKDKMKEKMDNKLQDKAAETAPVEPAEPVQPIKEKINDKLQDKAAETAPNDKADPVQPS